MLQNLLIPHDYFENCPSLKTHTYFKIHCSEDRINSGHLYQLNVVQMRMSRQNVCLEQNVRRQKHTAEE